MVIEAMGIYAGYKIANKMLNRELLKIKKDWKTLLGYKKLDGGGSKLIFNPFELRYLITKPYGYDLKIMIPRGCSIKDLQKLEDVIKQTYKSIIEINMADTDILATVRVVKRPMHDLVYEPIKTTATELYFGYGYADHVVIDMLNFPHVLITGATNTGKSKMLELVIINLLVNNSPDKLHLYLMQIEKYDLATFLRCEHVKHMAFTLLETYQQLKHLINIYTERNKLIGNLIIEHDSDLRNIHEYNLENPDKYLPLIFFLVDEAMFYMAVDQDKFIYPAKIPELIKYYNKDDEPVYKTNADIKMECYDMFNKLLAAGRACGIYAIMSLQRPDAKSLDPNLKKNINCIITYRQVNPRSSEVAIGDTSATLLDIREALLQTNKRYEIECPILTNKTVKKYITPFKNKHHVRYKLNYDGNVTNWDEINEVYHRNTEGDDSIIDIEYDVKDEEKTEAIEKEKELLAEKSKVIDMRDYKTVEREDYANDIEEIKAIRKLQAEAIEIKYNSEETHYSKEEIENMRKLARNRHQNATPQHTMSKGTVKPTRKD